MEKELIKGAWYIYATPADTDDFREATLLFSNRLNRFCLIFNGQLLHSSKTFSSLEYHFRKLKDEWNLTFNRAENLEIA